MKTRELTGALLDYWAALAELLEFHGREAEAETIAAIEAKIGAYPFNPSTNWAQGGPIIEREDIMLSKEGEGWGAMAGGIWSPSEEAAAEAGGATGPTPLVAAMRAYVARKFGDEVSDEVAV